MNFDPSANHKLSTSVCKAIQNRTSIFCESAPVSAYLNGTVCGAIEHRTSSIFCDSTETSVEPNGEYYPAMQLTGNFHERYLPTAALNFGKLTDTSLGKFEKISKFLAEKPYATKTEFESLLATEWQISIKELVLELAEIIESSPHLQPLIYQMMRPYVATGQLKAKNETRYRDLAFALQKNPNASLSELTSILEKKWGFTRYHTEQVIKNLYAESHQDPNRIPLTIRGT